MTTKMVTRADIKWMDAAARFAANFLGTTSDNPTVGALVVDGTTGVLISRGVTAFGGRPHAETIALDAAGAKARGATLYVTLEPCHHQGKTPPCVDAVINAGIARVVIGQMDRDPRTQGKSIEKLRAAGVTVDVLEGHKPTAALHQAFFTRITTGKPYVTAKLAVSSDNMVGEQNVGNVPITGPDAKIWTHTLRARVDGILVGANTARIDAPQLNVRLKTLENRSPKRFIFSREQTKLPESQQDAVLIVASDLDEGLAEIGALGINHLLVEGGPNLLNQMIERRMVDQFFLLKSDRIIGDKGLRASATETYEQFLEKNDYICHATTGLGNDVKKHYIKG